MKEDLRQKYSASENTFSEAPEEEREFLRLFSFICMLSFDVYLKKQVIEKPSTSFPDRTGPPGKSTKKKTRSKKT